MHTTSNLDDGYLGSGNRLKSSIRYYGKGFHKMEILEFLPDRNSLKKRESEIVNEKILKDPMCMNLILGGEGGWTREQQKKGALAANSKNWKNPEFRETMSKISSNIMSKCWADPEKKERLIEGARKSFEDKKHTEFSKELIGAKNSLQQKGEKNSQAGKFWITNEILDIKIIPIELENYISLGWRRGRNKNCNKKKL